ncbi:MAG: cytochrome c oxidase assembly protein [Chloroflexi bacterium]|nr:cytochrome c oxidase assembly protein [Chloroflexota bacterium]
MPESVRWLTAWDFEPSILIGLLLICSAYFASLGPLRRRFANSSPPEPRQIALFLAGAVAILLALVSPIDEIGDHYLFSFHMTQHLLLTMVMPPLLLLGIPGWMLAPFLRYRFFYAVGRSLTRAIPALLLFNVFFAFYHIPALYDLTLRDHNIHIVVHLFLMATALIAWMPICSPTPELPRLPFAAQILYLFIQAIPPTILGAVITFGTGILYPTYARAPRLFGMSALEDQQWAGMIMWIPGAGIYLTALTIVFFKWFGKTDSGQTLEGSKLE